MRLPPVPVARPSPSVEASGSSDDELVPPSPPTTPPAENTDEVAPLRPQGRRRPNKMGMPQRARSSRAMLYSGGEPASGRKKLQHNGLPPKAASTRGFLG
eukprot:CAMPEP_0113633014 /NCGR_PEP_ID=MMETSP0017_2-20120614/17170_1 /TAXON_ID=2856 /ORGANISM="Cylindrotheca closterium" /LENGTH=99 /DNA_ID=CAMNT_0000543613 /DNA_START=23 /DNA_END=322 /DNA_ORIENTATION=- /assembly_acc=CAM_ASM_000147